MSSLWNHAKLYKPRLESWFAGSTDCYVCGGAARRPYGLCDGCRGDLPVRRPRLARSIEFVDWALAAYRYEFPITDIVRAAKFHADLAALEILAGAFTTDFLAHLEGVDVLVPVPLLPWRFL